MRLALAQINPTVGDLGANAERARHAIERARSLGAEAVVLPELALCGYPPRDLLLEEGFVRACAAAAKDVGERLSQGITVIFGTPLPADDAAGAALPPPPSPPRVHNSIVVYRDARMLAYYDKRLLPTYDVFDEDRYFVPGERPVIVEAAGRRLALAICEDLWQGEDAGFASRYRGAPDPVADTFAGGHAAHVDALVVPSASPFVLGKGRRHRAILRRHALRHSIPVASVNQVGANDELIFDGHSCVIGPDGSLLAAAGGFEEDLLIADLPSPPPSPPALDPLDVADEELLFRALVLGVRDYLAKTGFRSALLGASGGIDSALVASIAVAALGPANVLAVAMPGPYSSAHALEDARELASRLACRFVVAPISTPVDVFRASIDPVLASLQAPPLGRTLPDLAEENLQSRARGTTLMALSNRTGALPLSTGNKSEISVGYCTLYGDMNGGLAVISDLTKAWVYRLARWLNSSHARAGFLAPPIPARSIDKPPSAELRPNQTDQDSLPPYDVLDEIVRRRVEERQSHARIERETGFDPAAIERVLRLIDASEYKRKQLATGLKVTGVAFGMGRRHPIAQRWRG